MANHPPFAVMFAEEPQGAILILTAGRNDEGAEGNIRVRRHANGRAVVERLSYTTGGEPFWSLGANVGLPASDDRLRKVCRALIELIERGAMVGNPDIDRDGAIDGEGDAALAEIRAIVGAPKTESAPPD